MSDDVFLSYAGEQAAAAGRIAEHLRAAGLSVWLDTDLRYLGETRVDRRVPAGSQVAPTIFDGIDRAASFVYIDSPTWHLSRYCQREAEHARHQGKRVVRTTAAPDLDGLVSEIKRSLSLGHAHATLLVNGDRLPWWRITKGVAVHRAALELSRADLRTHGIELTAGVEGLIQSVLKGARRRQRLLVLAAAVTMGALGVLVVAGMVARARAIDRNDRAHAEARHVESLALAAGSAGAPNTLEQVQLAKQAVALERSETTVAALRAGVQAFDLGVDLRIPVPSSPTAVAVSDTGRAAAVVSSDASLTLVRITNRVRVRVVPPATATAAPRLAVSPDGSRVAVVRKDGGGVAIVMIGTGRTVVVGETVDIADLAFASARELVMVRRDGAVMSVNPRAGSELRVRRIGDLAPEVRAAAVTEVRPGRGLSIGALHDGGTVEIRSFGDAATATWSTSLNDAADPGPVTGRYAVGRDVLRVCGGRLHVLTTSRRTPFELPFSIDQHGDAQRVGSLLGSFGSACLPTGDALYDDVARGQDSVPSQGISLLGFAVGDGRNVRHAINSSADGRWAVSAGSDGVLAVRRLAVVPHVRRLREAGVAVADGTSAVVAAGPALLELSDGRVRPIRRRPLKGRAARGAYEDPRAGAVLAVGREVLAVRMGVARTIAVAPEPLDGIRPDRPALSVLAIPARRDRLLVFGLDRLGQAPRVIPIPRRLRGDAGRALWDAVRTTAGRYAIATADGHVRLLASSDGQEVHDRAVGPPGRTLLAAVGAGRLAVGRSDGMVVLVDDRTLAPIRRVKAMRETIADLAVDVASGRLVARSFADRAVVLTLPALRRIADVGPVRGLVSAVPAEHGSTVLVGSNIDFTDGTAEGAVGSWPLCRICGSSDVAALEREARLLLLGGRRSTARQTFRTPTIN